MRWGQEDGVMRIGVVYSPCMKGKIEVEHIVDSYCDPDKLFLLPTNISLERYRQDLLNEIDELKKRYKYLERARGWIIKNIRSKDAF